MIDYSVYKDLLIEKDNGILTITLNAPDSLNAFTAGMHNGLSRIWTDVHDDPEVDVIVLTGAGRAFSAGGNVVAMQTKIDDTDLWDQGMPEAKRIIFRMLECDKPIIARVNGHAVGLGATVALFCDIIIAADHAKIGDPHVSAGLVAGDGGAVIWPQLIGFARAKEYLFTGDLMMAAEAERIGLINHCVPADELDDKVYSLARRLAAGASKSIRWTKQVVNIPLRQLAHSMMDLSLSVETQSNMSADHQEAVTAFSNKRKPDFTGG
ncbi:MAG: enoyl-CoA hydratase/isomerase family protein [Rhodospirillaceae bacterium]|jgi:enoyl-CoA hydratase|nr:enoyl-CoA hydratase/isomerase family protein [Rhodospirillaceae bacterium]MBT4486546.1 enoyl-CoA hydratase/isomerase family protein [Rhodospirillaceae bacterium]MBT5194895.1 enoyl-CoA hydratase/isomerase family protein [Rhodospirillaceae bacterium]MBT5896831.1 enoyl-CoA hydratase/isomerase family protein [Rhodospirillaceae bacterium]